jgi:hypothetical protein
MCVTVNAAGQPAWIFADLKAICIPRRRCDDIADVGYGIPPLIDVRLPRQRVRFFG